jgi:hypothetical protein
MVSIAMGLLASMGHGYRPQGRTDMRYLILVGAFALLVLSPLTASAQQKAVQTPTIPPTIEGVPTNKVLAIGVGVLAGAVVGDVLIGSDIIAVLGGAAGGFIAAWWYENSNGSATKAAMREPAGAPMLARAERLALAR